MFLVGLPGGSWQEAAITAGLIIASYFALLWLAVVFWTVRDAHQRLANPALEVGAGLLVLGFFLPGLWLYLILRPRLTLAERYERSLEAEAVLSELADRANCPQCARRVQDDFVVCPSCKYRLKEPCAKCARPLSFAWIACPGCGADNEARTEAPAVVPVRRRRARPAAAARETQPAQPQPQLSGSTGGN